MLTPLCSLTNLNGPVPTGAVVAAAQVVQSSSVSNRCWGRMLLLYHARLDRKGALGSFRVMTKVLSSGHSMVSTTARSPAR